MLKEDLILGEVISIRNELPVLGGRKLHHLLHGRLPFGTVPGRDAFFDLLRSNGLLIRKRKSFRPATTMSWHHFHKFDNLWKGRIPDGPNEVWVADITYIRRKDGGFLYLSLLSDAYSHKILGWHLSERLDMEGPLCALREALKHLPCEHKLMHHSDRGVQYCSKAYVEVLQSRGIAISMTEKGDPRENAIAERINGILKEEWINREKIGSWEQGRERMKTIIGLYNSKRPHLSNDYLTPDEAHGQNGTLRRRWKTYYKKKKYIDETQEDFLPLLPGSSAGHKTPL